MVKWLFSYRVFWEQRTRREQILLVLMTALLLGLLLIKGIWLPSDNYLKRSRPEVQQLAYQAQQMRQILSKAHTLKKTLLPAPSSIEFLLIAAKQEAQQQGLKTAYWHWAVNKVELTGIVEDFDQWLLYIATLEKKYRLYLKRCDIEAGETPGQVRVEAEWGAEDR